MAENLLFWIPVVLLFHSYILFPLLLHWFSRSRTNNQKIYTSVNDLPSVSIIISIYNEEAVVAQRIRNVYQSEYPEHLIQVLVGSDGSSDGTNRILEALRQEYRSLRIFCFSERRGKGAVLNDLTAQAENNILILTDAKVLFSSGTIHELVKHFKNPQIGIVGGNIINRSGRKDGISVQESRFMAREIMIKYYEGIIWGSTMGVYGACFAIRRELFERIPDGFAVEDFYITYRTLQNGYKVIMEPDALCFEDVPNRIREEFRRKVRISGGNFQNLRTFLTSLVKLNAATFCFFSHKIIRWIGPFLLVSALISNFLLAGYSSFYFVLLRIQFFFLILPIIDFFLKKIHIHVIPLRFVTHFYSMNLALLLGFIKYLKGVKTNVWEPTKRS